MSPAPTLWHQDVAGTIYVHLYNRVKSTVVPTMADMRVEQFFLL